MKKARAQWSDGDSFDPVQGWPLRVLFFPFSHTNGSYFGPKKVCTFFSYAVKYFLSQGKPLVDPKKIGRENHGKSIQGIDNWVEITGRANEAKN